MSDDSSARRIPAAILPHRGVLVDVLTVVIHENRQLKSALSAERKANEALRQELMAGCPPPSVRDKAKPGAGAVWTWSGSRQTECQRRERAPAWPRPGAIWYCSHHSLQLLRR